MRVNKLSRLFEITTSNQKLDYSIHVLILLNLFHKDKNSSLGSNLLISNTICQKFHSEEVWAFVVTATQNHRISMKHVAFQLTHHITHVYGQQVFMESYIFITSTYPCPKRDSIHHDRVKSVIRPAHYHQATTAGLNFCLIFKFIWKFIFIWYPPLKKILSFWHFRGTSDQINPVVVVIVEVFYSLK